MSGAEIGRGELLPAQRHAWILEHLRKHKVASIQEITISLGVSESTVRRDLAFLVEHAYLERTHGGAIIRHQPEARFEPDRGIAAEMARAEKQAIGALAAQRVSSGQSIILDASSTVSAAAEHIRERCLDLTVVTNDLVCATQMDQSEGGAVILTGGSLWRGTATLIGEPAQTFLSGIHVDVAFIGVHTISDGVFTETSLEVAGMKQRMIRAATRVIVLADASKFGPPSFCEICPISEVAEVITDAGATDEQVESVRAIGTLCTIADPGPGPGTRRG